jgi:hypothetical protein
MRVKLNILLSLNVHTLRILIITFEVHAKRQLVDAADTIFLKLNLIVYDISVAKKMENHRIHIFPKNKTKIY